MLDLDAARETFEAATDHTVGLEEEFSILDPETLELQSRFGELRDAAGDDAVLSAAITGELIASEIEIVSGRGEDLEAARSQQDEARRRLFGLAAREGALLGSTGTHPFSDYRAQEIIDTPHYRRRRDGLQYVARRNNTFSLHVHVGVRGADRAVRVCDRLRPILPTLLAISASSPFVDGMDAGLHSARSEIFTRTFPRCGIPDPFGSWQAWADYVAWLERVGSIVEFTQVWWSVRPHHAFGTVEVRICDAQVTRHESDALAELVVGCVRRAAEEVDSGTVPPDLPHRVIEENMWRAIRYGLDGELLDLDSATLAPYSALDAAERLGRWAGVDVTFPELNGAQRQRRMIDQGATPYEVFAETVKHTQATYVGEEVR